MVSGPATQKPHRLLAAVLVSLPVLLFLSPLVLVTAIPVLDGEACWTPSPPVNPDFQSVQSEWSWRDFGVVCVADYEDGRVVRWVER